MKQESLGTCIHCGSRPGEPCQQSEPHERTVAPAPLALQPPHLQEVIRLLGEARRSIDASLNARHERNHTQADIDTAAAIDRVVRAIETIVFFVSVGKGAEAAKDTVVQECPVCRGMGTVPSEGGGFDGFRPTIPCYRCGGTGKKKTVATP